ncbi:MAG TPA: PAS domain S-box protein [Syntrophomonadaceae bacterium]|nr:PAS domain S-box protein [Syntrophomonadaceae bacterium]
MLLPYPALDQQFNNLSAGDHLAALYESRSEWRSGVMSYIYTAFQKGNKIVWLVNKRQFQYLSRQYIYIMEAALQSGQLAVIDAAFIKKACKNISNNIIEILKSYTFDCMNVHFCLDWVFAMTDPEELLGLETLLHNLAHQTGSILFCQYDIRHLTSSAARAVLESHPRILRHGVLCRNIYYVPSDMVLNDKKCANKITHWLDAIYGEDKTRRETKFLAEVVQYSSNPFAAGQLNGQIMACNPAFEKLSGYNQEELRNINWINDLAQTYNHEDFSKQVQMNDQTIHNKKRYGLRRSDGTTIPIEFTVQRADYLDGVSCYYGFLTDITHHHEYEQALLTIQTKLQQRVRYLDTLIDHMNEFFYTYDQNGIITFVNKKAQEILGYSFDEMVGKPLLKFVVPEYHTIVAQNLRNRLQLGIANSYEHEIITSTGALIYVRANCAPIKNNSGILGGMVLAQDITESRKAELALRHQLELERLISVISSRFVNLEYEEIDQEIEKTLGLMGEFVGADNSYIFLTSEDGNRLSDTHEWCAPGITGSKASLQNLNAADYSWGLNMLKDNEYVYYPDTEQMPVEGRKELSQVLDLKVRSILAVPLRFHRQFIGFMGFTSILDSHIWTKQDVDLLKIAGEILISTLEHRRSEKRIKSGFKLFNGLTEGVMVIDHQGMVSWANRSCSVITGFSPAEIINRSYRSLQFLPEPVKETFPALWEQVESQGKWQGQVELVRRNGEQFTCFISISAVDRIVDHFMDYFAILVDITEQVKLQRERAQLKQQTMIAHRLASLSTLSAGIVHEIAQPLNAIKVLVDGMIYWHQAGNQLESAEVIQKLEEIALETNHINEIIKYIRSFANFKKEELVRCNLNQAVLRSLNLMRRQLSDHDITLQIALEDNLPDVCGHPNRLEEVVINLLVNAMQALSQSVKDNKLIECKTFSRRGTVILEIRDNATGIDDSIIGSVFEPFITSKPSGLGTGLGLSIVNTIVSNLGGKVSVYNNNNGGATFCIQIPAWTGGIKNENSIG